MVCLASRSLRVGLAQAELRDIPALALEILAEFSVFLGNGILANVGQAEEGDGGRKEGETGGDPERVLGRLSLAVAGFFNGRESVGADKSTNLANGGSNAVVATTDTSSAGLGSQKTNVVARAQFAKGLENAIDDSKSSDVLGDGAVDAGHDVANNGLSGNTKDEGILGANPITDKGAQDGSWNVKQIDDGVPAKDGRQRCALGVDGAENIGRVDAKGICRKLAKLSQLLCTAELAGNLTS